MNANNIRPSSLEEELKKFNEYMGKFPVSEEIFCICMGWLMFLSEMDLKDLNPTLSLDELFGKPKTFITKEKSALFYYSIEDLEEIINNDVNGYFARHPFELNNVCDFVKLCQIANRLDGKMLKVLSNEWNGWIYLNKKGLLIKLVLGFCPNMFYTEKLSFKDFVLAAKSNASLGLR